MTASNGSAITIGTPFGAISTRIESRILLAVSSPKPGAYENDSPLFLRMKSRASTMALYRAPRSCSVSPFRVASARISSSESSSRAVERVERRLRGASIPDTSDKRLENLSELRYSWAIASISASLASRIERIERVEIRESLPPTPLYVLLRIIASNTLGISKTEF